jgi:hypothetical protein
MIVTSENQSPRPVLQSLLKTLFDITLLRKGPEDLPGSFVSLAMIIVLWLFSGLAGVVLIERFSEADFVLGLFSGMVSILCFAAVVVLSGHPARLLQTISAIIGCGSLISIAVVAEYVLIKSFLGVQPAGIIATLIVFWSVPVKGHIIARAIERHWYLGIVIAIVVFGLQLVVVGAMGAEA